MSKTIKVISIVFLGFLLIISLAGFGITRIYLPHRGISLSIGGWIGETKGVHVFFQN